MCMFLYICVCLFLLVKTRFFSPRFVVFHLNIPIVFSSPPPPPGNPVAACFLKCFTCCLACAEKLVRFVTSLAYCDVAMNSTSYCEGAEHAVTLVQRHGGALVAVATWSFTGGAGGFRMGIVCSLFRLNYAETPFQLPDVQLLLGIWHGDHVSSGGIGHDLLLCWHWSCFHRNGCHLLDDDQ